MQANIKTWTTTQAEEDAMNDDHDYLWRQMISYIQERHLGSRDVLDFGCNQGGFLRTLYDQKPFREGVGVDIALDSLAVARQRAGRRPLVYDSVAALSNMAERFDLAFSHEVLYLVDDLDAHAEAIKCALKPGGVYYAAIGCHTENPQWPRWMEMISAYSHVPVQNYSLNDYADAFFNGGFSVSARPYRYHGFVPLKPANDYFPNVADSLEYHDSVKTLFRFVKGQ